MLSCHCVRAVQHKFVRTPDSEVVMKVVPRLDVPVEKQLPPLQRPFLRTADRFTVANLKQYLVVKFPDLTTDDVRAELC